MGSYWDTDNNSNPTWKCFFSPIFHITSLWETFFTAPLMFTKTQDQLTGPSRSVLPFQSDCKRWGEAQQLLDDEELQVSHGNLLAVLARKQHLQVNPKRLRTVSHTPKPQTIKTWKLNCHLLHLPFHGIPALQHLYLHIIPLSKISSFSYLNLDLVFNCF